MTETYKQYLRVLEMMIGSLSITTHLSAWKRVVGTNHNMPITAGYTPIQGTFGAPIKKIKSKLSQLTAGGATASSLGGNISFDEALFKFHDVEKLIFFSQMQLSLLNISCHLNTILMGDYGTGNFIFILLLL